MWPPRFCVWRRANSRGLARAKHESRSLPLRRQTSRCRGRAVRLDKSRRLRRQEIETELERASLARRNALVGAAGFGPEPNGAAREQASDDAAAETRSDALEARFQAGEADASWRDAEQESIADLVETAGLPPGVVRSLECRAQLCRMSLALPGAAAAARLQTLVDGTEQEYAIAAPPPDSSPRTAEAATSEGGLAYVVYLSRPGMHVADLVGDPQP